MTNDTSLETKSFEQYKQFIAAFEALTPFQLEHFTRMLFEGYQQMIQEKQAAALRQTSFDYIFNNAIWKANAIIAEMELEQAKKRLEVASDRSKKMSLRLPSGE